MVEPEFLASLPENVEEAFPLYQKHVQEKYLNDNNWNRDPSDRQAYIAAMLGFIEAHNIDIGIDLDIPNDSDDFRVYYSNAEKKISIYSAKLAVQSAWKTKGKNPSYVLTAPIRSEIHHHIKLIKDKLEALDLSQNKRDALFNRLNDFASEVDRDRTRADLITSLYIALKRDTSAGLSKMAPILDNVVKIIDCFSKAEESVPQITSTKPSGALEAPQKQLPPPKMDDVIPF